MPAFKPASPEEIARRYRGDVDDPGTRYYAEVDGEVVGYAVFCESGRISYPWCLPGAEDVREPLLDAVLIEMNRRGMPEAWATYRADWSAVLEFLRVRGFVEKRQMINYLADVSRLPHRAELPEDRVIEPIGRGDVFHLAARWPRRCSRRSSRDRSRRSSGRIRTTTSRRASSRSRIAATAGSSAPACWC